MSGVTVTAVRNNDEETADDTSRPSVASLVSRFSQRKPMGVGNSPSEGVPSSTPKPEKIPPQPAPKPAKRKSLQRAQTLSNPPTSPEAQQPSATDTGSPVQEGGKPQLQPRLSVSDLAKSLGSKISVGVEKQIKKNKSHVSVIQHSPPAKPPQTQARNPDDQTTSVSWTEEKTSLQNNRTSGSDIIDSETRVSDSDIQVQSVSTNERTSGESSAALHSQTDISQTSTDILSGGTDTSNSRDENYFFNDNFTETLRISSSQDTGTSVEEQTPAEQPERISEREGSGQPLNTANDLFTYMPSPPAYLSPPPLAGAPPAYDPAGWTDAPDSGSGPLADSAGQSPQIGTEAQPRDRTHVGVVGDTVSPSVFAVASTVGADIMAGLRSQTEHRQTESVLGFEDNFNPFVPITDSDSGERPAVSAPTVMPFHVLCGRNAAISVDQTEAKRRDVECTNAYVFMATPLATGQEIVLKVLEVEPLSRLNGMAVGMTACDPMEISPASLPDDADLLLDREEYWAVIQDISLNPAVGDELCFSLSPKGEVLYSRNGAKPSTLMYVDYTIPLWAFFDISGHATKIRSIDPSTRTVRSPQTSPTVTQRKSLAAEVSQSGGDVHKAKLQQFEECAVCFERGIDSVLYTCGHMCVCYNCAVTLKEERDGLCPLCRRPITDVIRVYRT